jgi:plasmid maintenance system antidote protein VapI
MMTLPEYLAEQKLTQSVFAVRVGLTQATISKLCRRDRPPISLETAIVIERETGGRVPLAVWPQFAALRDTGQGDPSSDESGRAA